MEQTIEQRLEIIEAEINILTAILHEYVAHENQMVIDRREVEQAIKDSDSVIKIDLS